MDEYAQKYTNTRITASQYVSEHASRHFLPLSPSPPSGTSSVISHEISRQWPITGHSSILLQGYRVTPRHSPARGSLSLAQHCRLTWRRSKLCPYFPVRRRSVSLEVQLDSCLIFREREREKTKTNGRSVRMIVVWCVKVKRDVFFSADLKAKIGDGSTRLKAETISQ